MTKAEKIKHCAGCTDDFFNGQNPRGVEDCWLLRSAQLIPRKQVPVSQLPPWDQPPVPTLSCYKRKGYMYFRGDRRTW